jgi:hypothetical protein
MQPCAAAAAATTVPRWVATTAHDGLTALTCSVRAAEAGAGPEVGKELRFELERSGSSAHWQLAPAKSEQRLCKKRRLLAQFMPIEQLDGLRLLAVGAGGACGWLPAALRMGTRASHGAPAVSPAPPRTAKSRPAGAAACRRCSMPALQHAGAHARV